MHRVAPKAVGIAGREFMLSFRGNAGDPPPQVVFEQVPPFIECAGNGAAVTNSGVPAESGYAEYGIRMRALRPGRGVIRIRIAGELFEVPAAVFRSREFFLCMVLSSNYHYGWDPLCFLIGNTPEQLELEGDAWLKLRQLEKMYHMRGIPVTWLIDEKVAAKAAPQIRQWHAEFGDDYGVMPTSYIHHATVNFNIQKSADEVTEFMRDAIRKTEAMFDFYTTTFAIDQWLGSVGGNFTEGAYRLGLNGLWGVGFDHRTCDTSMFHRGCPWDVYKPDRANFRIPAGHPSRLWMYQWTTRDVLLSMHSPDSGPSGAVVFSTDPDDVFSSRIMFEQPDYWELFYRGYRRHFAPQDHGQGEDGDTCGTPELNNMFCFLIHQEDHDCHRPENADLLRRFLDSVAGTATFATLEEVSAWLNLRYAPEEHPGQIMLTKDHLRCHSKVVWYAGVQKPPDWPEDPDCYPPSMLFYSSEMMWCANEGEELPWRFFDYTPRTAVEETGAYPESDLRKIVRCTGLRASVEDGGFLVEASLVSERAFSKVPLILWHALAGKDFAQPVTSGPATAIGNSIVLFTPIDAGRSKIEVRFKQFG